MNADPISRRSSAGPKRLRSKIPRRKRVPPLPIAARISNSDFDEVLEEESSSSCLHSEVSFDSSFDFAGSDVMKRPKLSRAAKSKKQVSELRSGDEFRRITRSYARKKEMERSEQEISEGNAAASEIQTSEVTQITGGLSASLNENAVSSEAAEKFAEISESSCLESVSDAKIARISNSVGDQGSSLQIAFDLDSGLACSEKLSDDECSDYSTCNEMTLSEVESELFYRNSQRDSSDHSLSVLFESPEDFSERSNESTPSIAFSIFRELAKQFARSSSSFGSREKSTEMIQDDGSQEFRIIKFEEEEDEESYKNIRGRERREVILKDFSEEFRSATDYGDLILQQRLVMVNWMVEHSQEMELQPETLFLGVSLMDRFLTRGYFETERNLQLLGIASVTIATRLEEVQPWNNIRRRSFTVGDNVYARAEVVAMEWLVLEVLNFQCMLPTTHNFLWFYLKAANADAEVESLTRYLAVLSLLDHERLCFWPSTVAAGLVILACLATSRDSSCLRVMERHVRSKSDDLPECIQSLEWLVKYVC
ncbi:cyclin-SDS-like [Asparagus officinalis]|uniref:cyclin-SDS-like n=1 Tax=Asparagus officinalis TaxID=4686 RepID=UPI00098E5F18|nr:cyclin-SDS-like [Asparagus officinalis]